MATAKTPTILDSNVVLDLLTPNAAWHVWCARQTAVSSAQGSLVINALIYAEASPRFENESDLHRSLVALGIVFEHIPWEAAYSAGLAHALYRRSGGLRERVLPDFLIGAHAAARGYSLLTRDGGRYRSYFPSIDIIAPDTHP